MENKHKYKNTGDKQTVWFVFFFALIGITIAVGIGIIANVIKKGLFAPAFFISFFPLIIGFILLALYVTSSKVKNKRGIKKLNEVLEKYSKEYILVKDSHKLDYVLITPYQIYGLLVRGYEGNLSGLENEDTWRQSLAFKKIKNALPNPIKECIDLSNKLSKRLGEEVEPVTVLTSGNRGYLNATHLYTPNELDHLVDTSKVKYNDEDLVRIKEAL